MNKTTEQRPPLTVAESEDAYRSMVQQTGEGILICDDQGRIIEWNRGMETIFGLSREQLVGTMIWDFQFSLIPEEARDERTLAGLKNAMLKVFREPGSDFMNRTTEMRVAMPGGGAKFVEMTAYPVSTRLGMLFASITRDITQRKMTENRLGESEGKYRALFQDNHATMLLIAPETLEIVDANTAACSYYGWTYGEITSRKLSEINVLSPLEIASEIQRALRVEQNHFHFKHRLADGAVREVETYAGPIRINGRELVYSIIHDVTDATKAGADLKASEVRYRRLFEAAQDGILILDADDGTIVDVNPFLANMLKYSFKDLTGKKVWELGFLTDIVPNRDKFFELRERKYVRYDDLPLEAADGSKVDVEFVSNVYLVENKKVIQCNIRDIRIRKKAVASMKASEEKFRSYIENAPDGVFIVDGAGRYLEANKAACRISGYSKEELVGMSIRDLLSEESLREGLGHFDKLMRTGASLSTLWLKRRDGTKYCLTIDAVRLTEGQSLGFCKDVTKRYEEELELSGYREHLEQLVENRTFELERAKKEAMSANRAKSVFLSSMSHEIRTPLNAILGFSELVLHDSKLSPPSRKFLETINRSGEHLLGLINDILEFSKIEAGSISLNQGVFSLPSMLMELKTLFQLKTESKGLAWSVELDDALPKFILSDEGKLRQIFFNLIGNALKFTEKGFVSVRVRVDRVADGKTYLSAQVEDTGPGIAEKELENLFKPFGQTEAGVKAGGTGLGLVLCRQYARLMDGDVTVRSEPGKGSIFSVTFAVRMAESSMIKTEPVLRRVRFLREGSKPCRVLIVDDLGYNRDLLEAFLAPAGFEVREAENGRKAVEVSSGWRPQVVLLDIRMPVMDGYEVMAILKKSANRPGMKIIATTASAFDEDRQRMLAAGADGYLRKPFKREELYDIIRSLAGVEYEYEDQAEVEASEDETALTSESLDGLPGELIDSMRKASVNLDYDELDGLMERTTAISPETGAKLRRLLKNYRYEALATLFVGRGA